jgi:homoserine dehydrogenase
MCCVTLESCQICNTKEFWSKISFRTFDTALGGLKGSDSFFEIYTESYGDRPIVIQGAGGSAVTARGVFRYIETFW